MGIASPKSVFPLQNVSKSISVQPFSKLSLNYRCDMLTYLVNLLAMYQMKRNTPKCVWLNAMQIAGSPLTYNELCQHIVQCAYACSIPLRAWRVIVNLIFNGGTRPPTMGHRLTRSTSPLAVVY